MGISIICTRFAGGTPVAVDPSWVEAAFAGCTVGREHDALLLGLDGSGTVPVRLQMLGRGASPDAFSIERPVEDPRLYAALFTVLRQRGWVALVPGSPPVVAEPGSPAELPADMIEALGPPIVAATPQALRDGLFAG